MNARALTVAIIALSLLTFISEFAVISLYADPPHANLTSIIYHNSISSWRFWFTSPYYPPFWDYFWHLFILAFGPLYIFTSVANATLIILGAAFVYLLLRHEGIENYFAALGFALTILSPAALQAAVMTHPESMMWLLLAGFLYFLVRSRAFTQVGHSIVSSVFLSLGLLSKWSFFGYSFLPALIESLVPAKSAQRKLAGFIAFVLTALVLCGPWYFGVMELDRILPTATNDPNLPVYSFWGMFALNLKILASHVGGYAISIVILAIAALALIFSRAKILWTLVSSIIGSIIFFSIPAHTEARYLWPLVPPIAAIVAFSAGALFEKFKQKWIAAIILVALALVNHFFALQIKLPSDGQNLYRIAASVHCHPKGTYEKFHGFLLKSLDYTKKPNPYIAIFPPLVVGNLEWGYPDYLKILSPQLVPYGMSHFDMGVYWEFRSELIALKHDAIIMDCKSKGDCESAFQNFLKSNAPDAGVPYRQPGMKTSEIKIVDLETVADDFKFIESHYMPVDKYEALPNHILVMWVKAQ